VDGWTVLGGIREVNQLQYPCAVVIAVADSAERRLIFEKIQNDSIDFPSFIHPQAIVGSKFINFGEGSIVTVGCILTTGIVVGRFAIVNLASTTGHDVFLGDFCSAMQGCNLSGNVPIGSATLIGRGTQVLQNVRIGKGRHVGVGVTRNLDDGLTVAGVPADWLTG
jgi:sugar O-acyltransferase (sialic acid O-acetyltransferase NeuD family)